MHDKTSLQRQWSLLKSLSARHYGITVREMAGEMGVSEKTIRRDLDVFRDVGFPLEETVGDFGRKRWRITHPGIQPPLSFRYDEALALYLGRKFLEPLAGTLFWDAAQRAFQKIRASLGKPALDYIARLTDVFHPTSVGVSDYTSKAELIDTLMVAIEDCKAVHILYQSQQATEPAFRDVYPYGMSYHRGSLYLVAHAPEYEEIRHYKVDRIEAAEISPFPFRRPKNFDLATHLATSFGVYQGKDDVTVRIRFVPDTARYVLESKWHPSQRLTKRRDGSVLAEFRLCGTEEIKSWVLSFGAKAVVLEPESLRREIQAELHALLAAYEAPATRLPQPSSMNASRSR